MGSGVSLRQPWFGTNMQSAQHWFRFVEKHGVVLDDKVTFVHRRLWPALVRLADEIPRSRLAQIAEVHTESGRHQVVETALEDWLPANIKAAARSLPRSEAMAMLPASIFAATGMPELGP